MSDRTPCLVPFCRRTRKSLPDRPEWICGVHWPRTDRRLRRLIRKVRRRRERVDSDRLYALHVKLWEKLKQQAIERAVGL